MKYDHLSLEKKWQARWKEKKTFKAKEELSRQKYYVLDMFPYPSGAGLHVGHLIGYTATDILARYKWSRGFEVLHPMGWDSFGLPAEQYAIRTQTHPAITTDLNIKKFKEQLESVGYAYDWERELRTSDPDYYKWTQWIFTKLFEKGLAYQAELLVNYCPALGTVLANEEVEGGKSKEGGHPVERRPLRQWVLKITEYADRLLQDLELVAWPEGLKKLQRNWIGKSHGAKILFTVAGKRGLSFEVFTTRPETLFGVTYLVLSPEHPLVAEIVTPEQREEVERTQKDALEKSDMERSELADAQKTGAFTGAFALHPVTQEKLPIWIADYVLMSYGTGGVMAVPAHDERDGAFATLFHLPFRSVIEEGKCLNSSSSMLAIDGLSEEEGKKKVIAWLEKMGKGKEALNYRLRDWLFSRQRYWGEPMPILHFEGGSLRPLELDELPLTPPQMVDFTPSPTGESPLAREKAWVEIQDPKTGQRAWRETNTMPQWAGSCWYYLRFCDPHNAEEPFSQEKERYWMPVDLYVGGAEHAVLHLLYARFWHKVLFDCGLVSTLEPFQTLLNQGLIVARSYQRKNGHYVPPEEVVETAGKFYLAGTEEELKSHIEKMSKSKLNGISPDEVREEFGADALRLYSMFMGPIDKEKVWNTEGVSGCKRFLNRFYEIVFSEKVREESSEEALRLLHKVIRGVTDDIEKMFFNTAISKMMEFSTEFSKLPFYPKESVKKAVQLLAPFAPHLGEEFWEYLGGSGSVTHAPWPKADPKYLVEEKATYVVQVNGKLRGHFELPKDQDESTILQLAKEDPKIAKHITGPIVKVIFVPNKLLNLVIR